MTEVDTTIPDWLNLSLTAAQRAAAWHQVEYKPPIARQSDPEADELAERIAASRARDAEVAAMLDAHREHRERMAREASLATITPEQKAQAALNRKLKKFKPKKANDAAAKPRRRRTKH